MHIQLEEIKSPGQNYPQRIRKKSQIGIMCSNWIDVLEMFCIQQLNKSVFLSSKLIVDYRN